MKIKNRTGISDNLITEKADDLVQEASRHNLKHTNYRRKVDDQLVNFEIKFVTTQTVSNEPRVTATRVVA